jgi:hypothetical protein
MKEEFFMKKLMFSLQNPTIQEIKETVEILAYNMGYGKDFPAQKIRVVFSEEVPVRMNSRKVKKIKEMKVKFFESTIGNFCYTFHLRSGYPLYMIDYSKIISLSIEKGPDIEKQRENFLKRFHPNAWDNIKRNPSRISEYDMKTVNIKRKFPINIIEDLQSAFEEKRDYSYKQYGEKRDLSVQTKMCDDGIFRAWYSSEFAGCLNGSYYVLINPTTAAFREDD